MSKFKIEHGASKIQLVLLKANIEDTIAQDIDRMAEWSNNDRRYIVNELLRFAISQEEDFLRHKAGTSATVPQATRNPKPASVPTKPVAEQVPKFDTPATSSTTRA